MPVLGLSLDMGNASPRRAMDYGQGAIVVGKARGVGNHPFARSLLLPITRTTGVTRITRAHNEWAIDEVSWSRIWSQACMVCVVLCTILDAAMNYTGRSGCRPGTSMFPV
jgi:hypothetical protein